MKIRDQFALDQLRVQRGHPIDRMTAHNGQMRHAYLRRITFCDNGHALQAPRVAGPPLADRVQKAPVNFIDDLQVPGQYPFQQSYRPGFERLGHQGVIGITTGRAGDPPGIRPLQVALVDQQAHQFRHGQRRVGVIELDGHLLGKARQVLMDPQIALHDIAQGAGHQKIFLNQAQFLAGRHGIRGIQQLGHGLGLNFLFHRPEIIAVIEDLNVKFFRGTGRKQPQVIHGPAAVSHHRHVVGDTDQQLPVQPHGVVPSPLVGGMLNPAVEGNQTGAFGAFNQPGR